jgi:hypothetical protein
MSSQDPQSDPSISYDILVADHNDLQNHLKILSTKLREYTLAQQQAKASEVALLSAMASVYRSGRVNDLRRRGQDVSKLHEELLNDPRARSLLKSFTPSQLGAGADTCSYADFSSNLADGIATSVTAAVRDYKREVDSLSALVQGYAERKARYDHYVSKLTSLSARAASEEDGMEAGKISAKLARNMEKLKAATLNHDIALEQAKGELRAATSGKGVKGKLDPITDRLLQFMGLDAGCRLGYVMEVRGG